MERSFTCNSHCPGLHRQLASSAAFRRGQQQSDTSRLPHTNTLAEFGLATKYDPQRERERDRDILITNWWMSCIGSSNCNNNSRHIEAFLLSNQRNRQPKLMAITSNRKPIRGQTREEITHTVTPNTPTHRQTRTQ